MYVYDDLGPQKIDHFTNQKGHNTLCISDFTVGAVLGYMLGGRQVPSALRFGVLTAGSSFVANKVTEQLNLA